MCYAWRIGDRPRCGSGTLTLDLHLAHVVRTLDRNVLGHAARISRDSELYQKFLAEHAQADIIRQAAAGEQSKIPQPRVGPQCRRR